MFALSDTPLDPEDLKRALANAGSGACVTFEGWVRDHNEGKRVHALEYEAYEVLCLSEGRRILEEAAQRFGLNAAQCVHRTGHLAIGDCAVWVGVSTAHRGEAFAACRYIIDEIKHRVPIWKKEHYTDGDTGWVNCAHCAAHAHKPAETAEAYYARQTRLPEVGETGQQRLGNARVLVVGAGGLGCPALQYLAGAGVGTIGICDDDVIDVSNLHRQPLFHAADAGAPKAEKAAEAVRALNPLVKVQVHAERLTSVNASEILNEYDILLDCTDNFEAKFLLNDLAVEQKKLLVQASIYQFEGQLFVYDPAEDGPCLRCIWPQMPAPDCVGSCAEVGVLGVVPGIFGAMQAAEAIKHILQHPARLRDRVLFFNLLDYQSFSVRAARAAECPVCSGKAARKPEEAPLEIDLEAFRLAEAGGLLIDMREAAEAQAAPFTDLQFVSRAASGLSLDDPPFTPDRAYLLCCTHGIRSRQLARALRSRGYPRVYSLAGGLRRLELAGRQAR